MIPIFVFRIGKRFLILREVGPTSATLTTAAEAGAGEAATCGIVRL
jgi:hypothetical protein